ncbi:MAG TPA: protein kinase, partial [Polyangiaceae bacterium]|nr:protein kinase [Polyangiaceae bacterium]
MGRDDKKTDAVLSGITPTASELRVPTAATSSRSSWAAPAPGELLANGRFEIVRRLGDGGMGVVYEAFDAERRESVALKTLHHLEPAGIYQLKSEFRVLADVSHPNLVRLHELFADDQTCFFTMDLVTGVQFDTWVEELRRRPSTNLSELCDSPWLEPLRAALAQLVEAVAALHAFGKLHRDLKPSNVMLTHTGQLIVLDFGLTIAPAADPGLDGELQGAFSGTPAYMAPEQVLGLRVSAASDWYALGVMLFQALTGSLPFQGSFHEIATAKQLRSAPPVAALFPDAPDDLAELCARLLATDPDERPDGASMLAEFGLPPPPASNRAPPSSVPPRSGANGSDMLGREVELRGLVDAYEASVNRERPVVVMLEGESGIGKTTLALRFTEVLRGSTKAVVLRGRCYERETVPFNAFDVIVDELSRYLTGLEKAEAAMFAPSEAWALVRSFPVLGRVTAFAAAEVPEGADPQEIRRRGFVALGELFGRMRERAPLVLLIDDLQWSDADSIRLLLHLLRQPSAPRLLFVGTRRNGRCPVLDPLYDKLPSDIRIDFRECRVAPLPPELAVELIGGDAPKEVLHEARGNPFLLTELSRYALARGSEGLGTHSLNEILWERCAELPEASQRLLRTIALSAVSVPLALVIRAAGVEPNAHDELRDRQLVRRGVRDGEVECYHDKIREAVVAKSSAAATQATHRALAEAWEATQDPDPELLAAHYAGAGERQRASELCVHAAERASRSFGFERAVELYGRALEQGHFGGDTLHRVRI